MSLHVYRSSLKGIVWKRTHTNPRATHTSATSLPVHPALPSPNTIQRKSDEVRREPAGIQWNTAKSNGNPTKLPYNSKLESNVCPTKIEWKSNEDPLDADGHPMAIQFKSNEHPIQSQYAARTKQWPCQCIGHPPHGQTIDQRKYIDSHIAVALGCSASCCVAQFRPTSFVA